MSSIVLFQGVTMNFRKVYSESEFVRKEVKRLQGISSVDIERTCSEAQSDDPMCTMREQPAIFAVSMAKFMESPVADIDLSLGHSFGEYAALCASRALTEEDAMRVVEERGRLAALSNSRQPGDMAAIMGEITKSSLSEIIQPICHKSEVDLAGINSPGQATISGPLLGLRNACNSLQKYNFRTMPLNVRCAFHSRYLRVMQDEFREFLNTIQFSTPKIPVLMNATASCEENPELIKDYLAEQLTAPLDFPRIVDRMNGFEIEQLHEIGAKEILIGFIKKIREIK